MKASPAPPPVPDCRDLARRRRLNADDRRPPLNGIDYVEPEGPDRLRVRLLAPLAGNVAVMAGNVRIDGGKPVHATQVTRSADRGDTFDVRLDHAGEIAAYTLRLVESDDDGSPGVDALNGFDPVLNSAGFSIDGDGDGEIDCAAAACPPRPGDAGPVAIDYLAKDYSSFLRLIYDRLAVIAPEFTERHAADLMVTLLEVLAYTGDYLSYFQDAVATEAYLQTARRRISVRRHARLVDYVMHEGCNARAWVCFAVSEDVTLEPGFVLLTGGPSDGSPFVSGDDDPARSGPYLAFEPLGASTSPATYRLKKSRNAMSVWTWGNTLCCLPAGATSAALVDAAAPDELDLRPGDVVVFEERVGPHTGLEGDADATRRHAVRLTAVTPGVDPAFGQAVLNVRWSDEDALPFDLCLSSVGPAPACEVLTDVSVVRGNVILVDHGLTIGRREPLDIPPGLPTPETCCGPGEPAGAEAAPVPFRGTLAGAPLTHAVPFPRPADEAQRQRVALADLPQTIDGMVRQLWRSAARGTAPTQAQIDAVRGTFGRRAADEAGLAEAGADGATPTRQAAALHRLLKSESELLAYRLGRVRRDLRIVRAGAPLPDDRLDELAALFGDALTASLGLSAGLTLGSAAAAVRQDPRDAVPGIALYADATNVTPQWAARRDLLDSSPSDLHFVAEVDDAGRPAPRFGDGRCGALPPAGTRLWADYRVGVGAVGNVPADSITRLWDRGRANGNLPVDRLRNPLAATGGVDPEPVDEVRLRAPASIADNSERAVTADDYADLAQRHPAVQRAAAVLRWTGTRYEAHVAIDPLGSESPSAALLEEIEQSLSARRRIGHDVRVTAASYVPLDVRLSVTVAPHVLRGHVLATLRGLFGSGELARGGRGFFHADNVSFGDPVVASRLVELASRVPGVIDVRVTRLARRGEEDMPADGVLRVRPLQIVRVDGDPRRPGHGGVGFELEGGR